uniref:Predicted membrane protein n=1 Tax=uncultured Atribacterota bacterium TaxID=263865 RepID=G3BMS5_9BACT|nr:predicted membrane protein [uncultured Atribacterota bacterium]
MLKSYYLVRIAFIAALYITINIIFAPISYGPVQVRVAEAMSVLPFIDSAAIGGLFLGCILANLWGGLGIFDVIGGSLCTLIAAFLTYKMKKPIFAPLPPVVVNSLGVSLYLHILFKLPYWLTVSYIFLGQLIACYLFGYPLLVVLIKRKIGISAPVKKK